jgi:regulator of sirC expression with transglutaminase-like and TPR domain
VIQLTSGSLLPNKILLPRVQECCKDFRCIIRSEVPQLWQDFLARSPELRFACTARNVIGEPLIDLMRKPESCSAVCKDAMKLRWQFVRLYDALTYTLAYAPQHRFLLLARIASLAKFGILVDDAALWCKATTSSPRLFYGMELRRLIKFHQCVQAFQQLREDECAAGFCSGDKPCPEDGFVVLACAFNANVNPSVLHFMLDVMALVAQIEILHAEPAQLAQAVNVSTDGLSVEQLVQLQLVKTDRNSAVQLCLQALAQGEKSLEVPYSDTTLKQLKDKVLHPSLLLVSTQTVAAALSGQTLLSCLAASFADRLGFRGNEAEYYKLSNSLLDKVMRSRRGIPISLSVLYAAMARRAGVAGLSYVSSPGHFLLKFSHSSLAESVYVNTFHGCRLENPRDMLLERRIPTEDIERWFPLSTNVQMWTRALANVQHVLQDSLDVDAIAGCAALKAAVHPAGQVPAESQLLALRAHRLDLLDEQLISSVSAASTTSLLQGRVDRMVGLAVSVASAVQLTVERLNTVDASGTLWQEALAFPPAHPRHGRTLSALECLATLGVRKRLEIPISLLEGEAALPVGEVPIQAALLDTHAVGLGMPLGATLDSESVSVDSRLEVGNLIVTPLGEAVIIGTRQVPDRVHPLQFPGMQTLSSGMESATIIELLNQAAIRVGTFPVRYRAPPTPVDTVDILPNRVEPFECGITVRRSTPTEARKIVTFSNTNLGRYFVAYAPGPSYTEIRGHFVPTLELACIHGCAEDTYKSQIKGFC